MQITGFISKRDGVVDLQNQQILENCLICSELLNLFCGKSFDGRSNSVQNKDNPVHFPAERSERVQFSWRAFNSVHLGLPMIVVWFHPETV